MPMLPERSALEDGLDQDQTAQNVQSDLRFTTQNG